MSTENLIQDCAFQVNWDLVAERVRQGENDTTDDFACYHHFMLHHDKSLNKDSWSKEEDELLLHLVQQHGQRNWESVTQELGTNRLVYDVFKRFKHVLSPETTRCGNWTKEEDDALDKAVAIYGTHDWSQSASTVGKRTRNACRDRFLYQRGKKDWTEEQKKLAMRGYKVFGRNWVNIEKIVPGKNARQIQTLIDTEEQTLTTWTEEEDNILHRLISEIRCGKWKEITRYHKEQKRLVCMVEAYFFRVNPFS